MEPNIQLKNLHFGYSKKNKLFENLNLNLFPGHIYGLLGKNGAGKTTLLKIMAGLCFPKQGESLIFNKQSQYRYPDILEKIYFLPEEIFIPHLQIKSYVKNYAAFYPKFNHDQFIHYLEEFEITDQETYLDKISHGQKKKVVMSFALATNTDILFMDEPTNGLDIPSKSIFRRIMASAADENRVIIISTHQVRDLHSLIDSIIILDNGEIILNEPNEKITEKLRFKLHDDSDREESVIYKEETLQGIWIVKENLEKIDSKLDIELLFNAMVSDKKRIKEIFKPFND